MKKCVLGLVLIISGFTSLACDGKKVHNLEDSGTAQINEMIQTEKNQQRLMAAQPLPQLQDSLERKQLITRLQTFNDPDRISYITLLSMGRPVGYFAIKGKVSSVNSLLTSSDQVLWSRGSHMDHTSAQVVASPDLDGSYGSNGDAVFFFLQDGTYMEWNGEYLISTRPVRLGIEPIIIQEK